ncbi:hypothetical protein PG987_005969 [Apiospora arundinis]
MEPGENPPDNWNEQEQDWTDLREMAALQNGPWPASVFTHGDLNPSNIFVRGDEVVGIIDWETAGWYPDYWEYTSAWTEKEKVVPGERYHVKNDPHGRWVFEALRLENVRSTATLLVRVVIAKITDERRLIQLLRQVPVVQDDPEWRCRTWVAQVLQAIERDGHCVSSAVLNWPIIEAKAREYAAAKAAAGRYGLGKDMLAPKPTYNILERRETVP